MKLSSQENRMLEMATRSFFPKDGRWSSSCFNRSNALEIKYLPCHLRDNLWLSLMLKKEEELELLEEYSAEIKSVLDDYNRKSTEETMMVRGTRKSNQETTNRKNYAR